MIWAIALGTLLALLAIWLLFRRPGSDILMVEWGHGRRWIRLYPNPGIKFRKRWRWSFRKGFGRY